MIKEARKQRQNKRRTSSTHLTDPFGEENMKHRINHWSRAAEAEATGMADSFRHVHQVESVALGSWRWSLEWPTHSVITMKTTTKSIGGSGRKKDGFGMNDSLGHVHWSTTKSVGEARGAREPVAQRLPCTVSPIHSVVALWADRISRSRQNFYPLEQWLVSLVGAINTPLPGHFKGVRAWRSYRVGSYVYSSALSIKVLKRRLRQLAKVLGLH
jgi:hypothetical protein